MKTLYIEPMGGLANRMRVIASVIKLTKIANTQIHCNWIENNELMAPFNRLFQDIDRLLFVPSGMKKLNGLKESFRHGQSTGFRSWIHNKRLGFDVCISAKEVSRLVSNGWLREELQNGSKRMYLQSWMIDEDFDSEDLINIFKPTKQIEQQTLKYLSKFSEFSKVIGIHIRRSDNAKSIENSPVERFVEVMEDYIKSFDGVGFFLATDDRDIEYLMSRLYPGKIITQPKVFSRATFEGIASALVDLILLSKTEKIYGSYWSSFTTMAGKLSGIPCVTVCNSNAIANY